MRLNYKQLIGLVCLVIGIVLIVYSQYMMHHHVAVTKAWYDKVKDFFIHIGNVIAGKSEEASVPNVQAMQRIFISGIGLACVGTLLLIFNRFHKKK